MKCKLDPDDLAEFRNKVETGQSRRDGRQRWRDDGGDHSETLWVNLANEDATRCCRCYCHALFEVK
jgi:hypothetical protein